MFLPARIYAKRFRMSPAACIRILQKANIPAITPAGKKISGSDSYYEESQALPVLRKVKRRHNVKECFV